VPVITTVAPTEPLDGAKPPIVGGPITANAPALVAVPPGVVTEIGPVAAPAGTAAVIWAAEFTVKAALVPLNWTDVAPVKLVPVMTTLVPTGPLVGEKPEIVGAGITMNGAVLVAVPPGVVTEIGPVVAAAGTVAVTCVVELTVKDVLAPLNWTAVVPPRFVPVTTTLAPTGPPEGAKPPMVGGPAGVTVKLPGWRE